MKIHFDSVYRDRGEFQKRPLDKVMQLLPILRAEGSRMVLDLGCGTGRHSIPLARAGFDVHAVDASQTALDILEAKLDDELRESLKLRCADMLDTSFPDQSFDAVLCVWTMGHGGVQDFERAVEEIRRMLKPNGLVMTDVMSVEDETYGRGELVEPNTFVGSMPGEEDIPHFYCDEVTAQRVFAAFGKIEISRATYTYVSAGQECRLKAWDVLARR